MFTLTYKIMHLIFKKSSFKFWFKKKESEDQLSITSQIHRPISELYWTQYCTKEDCSREIWSGTKGGEDGRSSWHRMEGETHTEAGGDFLEEPQPAEKPCLSIFVFLKDCIPREKAYARAGGIVSRQELWRGAVLDWSRLPLVSTPAALAGGVGISGEGAQCSWREREAKALSCLSLLTTTWV